MILAPNTPIDRAVREVEGLGALVGASNRLLKFLRGFPRILPLDLRRADVILMPDWHRTCRVILDEDAQVRLGQAEVVALVYQDMSHIGVNLRATAPRSEGGQIEASVDRRRIGILGADDANPYWEVSTDGTLGEALVASTIALRTRDTDGSWRLDLGAPKDVIRPPLPLEEDLPDDHDDDG